MRFAIMAGNLFLPDDFGDWRSQWDAIYAFVSNWLQIDFHGNPPIEKVFDLERTSDIVLPPSAHEWLRFATASRNLEPHFIFRDCLVVERVKDQDAVSLLLQGEGDIYWAVETQFLTQDNPPVTAYYLNYDDPNDGFVEEGRWAPTVTSFALDYFLDYLFSPGGGFAVATSSPNFRRDLLISDLGEPVNFGHLEMFYADGILAVLSTLPANWNHDALRVFVQKVTKHSTLPDCIQRLIPDAHVLQGVMGKSR